MGLLDDLKKQADDLKAREQQEKERLKKLNDFYQENIHPGMLSIYKYLNEMIEHLNYLNKDIPAQIPLLPNHEKTEVLQKEYNLVIDSIEQTKNISLKFRCTLPQKLEIYLTGKDRILDYNDWLNSYKIRFNRRDTKDDNYELLGSNFIVEGPINCNVSFIGDIENSCVNLLLRNVEYPGIAKHILKPHHLNDEFMDKLGKYLLRENDDFLRLDMDESAKEQIRKNLEEDQKQREKELQEMEELLNKENKRKGLDSLFNKIKPKK